MAKPRIPVEIGQRFGQLTVTGQAPNDKAGHLRYHALCACGNELTVPATYLKHNKQCGACKLEESRYKRRKGLQGKIIQSWQVIRFEGMNEQGEEMYRCRCTLCNRTSTKKLGEIKNSKGAGCQYCKPQYDFIVKGNQAAGILPCGTKFYIDKDMIESISQFWWHRGPKNYVVSEQRGLPKLYLHRLVMGLSTNDEGIADHINRNPLDCRRDNLRMVTPQQNSMNKSLQSNSQTGYVGVAYISSRGVYRAQIGLNNQDIYLCQSKDPRECASAYNYAADLLFGSYRGHVNDVPDAPTHLKRKVEDRCRPYIFEAIEATQPSGFFAAEKGA